MTLRKLVRVVPIVAALALAAPVASAHAQSTPAAGPAAIPCYPYPAFCGPNGQPWFSFPAPITIPPITIPTLPPIFHFGPGPVQLPTAPVRVQAP
jgi:hypothetical protein